MPSPLYYLATFGNPPSQTLVNLPMPINWSPSANTLDFANVNIINFTGAATPFVTVSGSGTAQYTTLVAALNAGKTNIFVIGNTTETTGYSIPAATTNYTICILPGVTVTPTSTTTPLITASGPTVAGTMYVYGGGSVSVGAQTTPTNGQFYATNTPFLMTFNQITFTNLATDLHYMINAQTANGLTQVINCKAYCTTAPFANINLGSIDGLYMGFSGVLPTNALSLSLCNINNLYLDDIATSGSAVVQVITLLQSGVNNIISNVVGRSYTINLNGNSFVNNFNDVGTVGVNFTFSQGQNRLNNCISSNGSFAIGGGANGTRVSACAFSAFSSGTTSATVSPEVITNTTFTSASGPTVNCNNVDFTACQFIGTVQVSGSNSVVGTHFTSCKFGVPGGSSTTVNVQSGTNKTVIANCQTNGAIINNGTATSQGLNTIF